MTPFDAAASASPWAALALGALSFTGQVGIGSALLSRLAPGLPTPWRVLIGAHTGGLLLSTAVIALGMAAGATPTALAATWLLLTAVGLVLGAAQVRRARAAGARSSPSVPTLATLAFLAPVAACTLAGLVVAMAPASHADSVFYHMVPARRLVEEGALTWARYPFNSAVLVQMVHQLAAAPLHALGHPDAADVSSYGYWVLFLWFARRLLARAAAPRPWAWLVVAALGTGLYPAEWYGSGGAHAFGDTATAALGVLLVSLPALMQRDVSPRSLALACGVLLAATAGAKISMAPVATVALVIALVRLRAPQDNARRANLLDALILPGLLTLGPLLLFTWHASGSPFGPYLAGTFGDSAYQLAEIREDIAVTVAGHRPNLRYLALFWGLFVSPLLWLGVLGYFIWGEGRRTLGLLLTIQAVLLAGWLPFDPRYLGGLQYSALLLFGLSAPSAVSRRLSSLPGALATALLGLGFWTLVGTSHASDALPAALGQQSATDFHTAESSRGAPNTPFFDTWLALDQALPPDAELLVYRRLIGAKVSVAFAPRPIHLHPDDVPSDRGTLHLLWLGRQPTDQIAAHVAGFRDGRWQLGEVVHRDDAVSWQARDKGQAGQLRVFVLERTP